MDEDDFGCEYDEGSDADNWEDEQVFQDSVAEGREEEEDFFDALSAWEDEQEDE